MVLLQLSGVGRRRALKAMRSMPLDGVPAHMDPNSLVDHVRDVLPRKNVLVDEEVDKARYRAEEIVEACESQGVRIVSYFDEEYPVLLKRPEVTDPPAILYVKGDDEFFRTKQAIAVVGTRHPTSHGARAAERLGEVLSERGYVVVAGLALGVDTLAHWGAVRAGRKSCAVMPCGPGVVYPSSNRELAEAIIDTGGCLVCEYAPGMRPSRSSFVERDRIQAGISLGTIAVETSLTGGTMHAVRACRACGRPVGCYLPSPEKRMTAQASGPVAMVREGIAFPIDSPQAIDEYCDLVDGIAADSDVTDDTSTDTGQLSLF